jgi:uncharacterized membrane protein (DUF106 family)
MKICLLFFAGLLWVPVIILPASGQLVRQEKCSEYQKSLNELQEVQSELMIAYSKYNDEHPLIKSLQEKKERLSKLLQKQAPYYLSNKCILPNSSTPEPIRGLW